MAHTERRRGEAVETAAYRICRERGEHWDTARGVCVPLGSLYAAEYARRVATAVVPSLTYTGLSPDAPIDTNEQGGQQSKVEGRFDLIPPVAMFELAKVMQHGAERYAPRNWYKIPLDSHLNHLLMHAFAYLAGDRQEDHLSHILARAAMAVEINALEGDVEDAA
jgi:hypothetical protein